MTALATQLVIEAQDRILDAPRTVLADQFCGWLEGHLEMLPGLPPGEVVVSLTNGVYIRPPWGHRGAVGTHVVVYRRAFNTRHEVAVAYGEDYRDEHAVAAWLVSIPHELLHVAEFAAKYGSGTPADLAREIVLNAPERDEDGIEDQARRIVDAFVREFPDACRAPELLRGYHRLPRPRAAAAQSRAPRLA